MITYFFHMCIKLLFRNLIMQTQKKITLAGRQTPKISLFDFPGGDKVMI